MDELIAFVTARLDEDEAAAKAASSEHLALEARDGRWRDVGNRHVRYDNGAGETLRSVDVTGGPCMWYEQISVRGDPDGRVAAHIARHDPARVLREVATWRRILLEYQIPPGTDAVYGGTERETGFRLALSFALKAKALEWKDHPDWQEWAPQP